MAKHNGYDLVRPMFTSGKLKTFSEIFQLVPKTVVANDLGKEKRRFNELIKDPNDLSYQEIRNTRKIPKETISKKHTNTGR
jgi:hypothetical protein